MKITYGVIEEKYTLENQMRASYGMAIFENNGEDSIAAILDEIHDITADRAAIEALSTLCNELQLAPIHFMDVIEDFLAQ